MRTSAQIRQAFIDFFVSKGHKHVASSSLVPNNDPTLLFTNSGMVQFKDTFLGAERRDYTRAVTSQRCVRAGGKHNDLDQVGYTARHHTFFEMLGNFSFGDYFKRDAIHFAWEFLTGVMALPKEKLWVTVYHSDNEAFDLWEREIGVPRERIVRIDDNKGAPYASDNFWQMADTGPCGPCSEIFFDHGPKVAGGPPGSEAADGDRYIEIWNLVFMQFERAADGTLTPLPKPCVDTGMGLERLSAVLQHKHNNYEIDSMHRLVAHAGELTHQKDLSQSKLRVLADHIRATAFMIVDGVLPSNEGRGYVCRRIVRRALRHGWQLGMREPFFYKLVPTLVELMGDAYPELRAKAALVADSLRAEEARFGETLDSGLKMFEQVAGRGGSKQISGNDVFRLYDTYGFPADLTQDIARERGFTIDEEGFKQAMEQQREQARAASRFAGGYAITAEQSDGLNATQFVGYDGCKADHCRLERILLDGGALARLDTGDTVVLILERTPFYAESGGQQGDSGVLHCANARFEVSDTIKLAGVYHAHIGRLVAGRLQRGDMLSAEVDPRRRQAIVLNHSATHLLHAALRQVLGEHVQQKGSLVAPDRLRFDFSHYQPVTREQLVEIERLVNAQVRNNYETEVQHMGMQDALDMGAMALFGEKYGEHVRVLRMGGFSTELCGGTHVHRSGDIGLFKVLNEGGVASGVRRIEAVSGAGAVAWIEAHEQRLRDASALLSGPGEELVARLKQVLERQKQLERELDQLKAKAAGQAVRELHAQAVDLGGIKLLAARLEGVESKALRDMLDQLKADLKDAVVLLAGAQGGKVQLIAGVSGSALGKVKAGDLLGELARQINGKGGGRPDMAQGGGDDVANLPALLAGLQSWVGQRLGSG